MFESLMFAGDAFFADAATNGALLHKAGGLHL